jgi:predicted tellurium resistance membrane protein TerC
MKLMERYPIIITAGAAILGWVAGEMLVTDPILKDGIDAHASWMHIHLPFGPDVSWAQIVGAILVVVAGKWIAARKLAKAGLVDLVAGEQKEKP